MTQLAQLLSPVAVLNATAADPQVIESTGLAYGSGSRDGLDLYRPVDANGARPACVFFYGGGWEDGDRADYRFVGMALAGQGVTTAIPDYRLYPEVTFPAFLADAARAVRFVRDRLAADGQAPRLVLAGHSAGAHIAAMLALEPVWLRHAGVDPVADIAGFVGLAGPYDFLPLRSSVLKSIFGPEAGRAASQPINFVTPTAPPALLATGRRDRVVEPGNTARLAERLREAGTMVEERFYPLASHETLIGAFARPLRFIAPVLRDTVGFITRVTGTRTVRAKGAA